VGDGPRAESEIRDGDAALHSALFYQQADARSTKAAVDAAAPDEIGGYEIVGVLGVGGTGVVYEARQRALRDRSVALKVLRHDAMGVRARWRLDREVDALSRLQHPGIGALYEAGWWEEHAGAVKRPFLAMELVRGRPLTTHADDLDLDRRQRLALFAEVCDAVEHAHARGVVHRDLKPSNILVLPDGRPKVLDFGIARLVEHDGDVERTLATSPGEIVGTLPYMSPEQLEGRPERMDHRTDVYSLGVILFELLTGSRPHAATSSSLPALARAIRDDPPARIGRLDRALRGDIETIVGKALEKSPADRFRSAEALADDIRRHLEHRPLLARPTGRIERCRRFVRRHRALTAAAGMIILSLITATAVSSVMAVRADRARALAERRFDDVRRIANSLVFELHDEIASLPGASGARALVIERAMEQLQSLRAQKADDPALLLDVAAAYMRLGDAAGEPVGPNLGDFDAAQRAYEAGLATLDALPNGGDDDEALSLRASLLQKTARAGDGENNENARMKHQAALAIQRELAARRQGDPDVGAALVHSLVRAGVAMHYVDEHDEMVALLEEAVATAESLAASAPANTLVAEVHADAAFWRAEMPHFAGLAADVEHFDLARTLAKRLVEMEPSNDEFARMLLRARMATLQVGVEHGRREGLREEMDSILRACERRVASDPENQQALRDHEVFLSRCAVLLIQLGEDESLPVARRLEHYRESRRLQVAALELTLERKARGWLFPWEADYIELAERDIAKCDEAIARLERAG